MELCMSTWCHKAQYLLHNLVNKHVLQNVHKCPYPFNIHGDSCIKLHAQTSMHCWNMDKSQRGLTSFIRDWGQLSRLSLKYAVGHIAHPSPIFTGLKSPKFGIDFRPSPLRRPHLEMDQCVMYVKPKTNGARTTLHYPIDGAGVLSVINCSCIKRCYCKHHLMQLQLITDSTPAPSIG